MEHRLDAIKINVREGFAASVVLASQGYPGAYVKGKTINIGTVPDGMECIRC